MRRSKSCFPCARMGTAALPIETPFILSGATPSWPASDGGFAKGSIDLGGLEARQVTTFAKVWSTTQGGQDGLGATFFQPSPVPTGFFVLGHYAQPNNRPLFGRVLVGRDSSGTGAVLAPPLGYTLVWSSTDGAGFFWLPTARPVPGGGSLCNAHGPRRLRAHKAMRYLYTVSRSHGGRLLLFASSVSRSSNTASGDTDSTIRRSLLLVPGKDRLQTC